MTTLKQLIPGVYQHYKGQSYLVFVCTTHTESGEPMVVYRSDADEQNTTSDKPVDNRLWTRPAAMFNEQVEVNGAQVPRFRFMRPLHHSEKLEIY
jgi:hypothetical protein